MTIMDARIVPLENGYSIDTYVFMEQDERIDIDESRMSRIRHSLTQVLAASDDNIKKVTRAAPRKARMFKTKTRVEFGADTTDEQASLELITADRPGLLSRVGQVFIDQGINITSAKIMTIGERAEDVFCISHELERPLTDSEKDALLHTMQRTLDGNNKQD